MKKVILVLVMAVLAASCKVDSKNKVAVSDAKSVAVTSSESIKVDVDISTISWKGFKPGGEHFGVISISEGSVDLENGNLVGGSFMFDMNSIVDKDMPADNEYNAKLVGHLKSSDFFDVAKFPTAKFEITSVANENGKLNVSGNLTIKAATKNITIPASFVNENGLVSLKSDVFTIDRTDFDVRYGSKKFFDDLKDKFINDEFEISFDVKAAN
jgi:polyisoprenoid-binding protein YceI